MYAQQKEVVFFKEPFSKHKTAQYIDGFQSGFKNTRTEGIPNKVVFSKRLHKAQKQICFKTFLKTHIYIMHNNICCVFRSGFKTQQQHKWFCPSGFTAYSKTMCCCKTHNKSHVLQRGLEAHNKPNHFLVCNAALKPQQHAL